MKICLGIRTVIWCVIITFFPLVAGAVTAPGQAAIATAHPLATRAGNEILADIAAGRVGERGLLASDITRQLPTVMNPA